MLNYTKGGIKILVKRIISGVFLSVLLITMAICFTGCEYEADPGLVETKSYKDVAQVVEVIHKNSTDNTPARHRIVLHYRYTDYTFDVSHELEQNTEVGAMFDVDVTVKYYNYGVDKYEINLIGLHYEED